MEVTKRTHLQARLQNTVFMVLLAILISLIAWLSTRYEIKADWTVNHRHTLSEASQKVLDELSDPITITAYASNDNSLRRPIKELIERYQRHKMDIRLRFVDPFTVPGEVQERGIRRDGELIIYYQERSEHVREIPLSEQTLTSVLQQLARTERRLIVFLEGHGERHPTQFENHDFNQWAQALENGGLEVQTLNFAQTPTFPIHTDVLVIATPRKPLLPGEITAITEYVDKGGHLLWLLDPDLSLQGLEPLAKNFGLTRQPGLIVDPVSQFLGMNNPAIVSITNSGYAHHPVTENAREYLTLFPHASGLLVESPQEEGWLETPLLTTNSQAWSETQEEEGMVEYNEGTDINGPLTIAYALVRDQPETETPEDESEKTEPENEQEKPTEENSFTQEQRIIIVGEGDFLSNAFLGYGGNLDLGLKMINWLAQEDAFIDIPSKTAVDLSLKLSPNVMITLGGFFLFLLPLTLIGIGISIWLRRRKA